MRVPMGKVATPERRSLNSFNTMNKLCSKRTSGSNQKQNEPRLIGNVLKEHFQSNEPLAKANRQRLASVEISAEKGGEV